MKSLIGKNHLRYAEYGLLVIIISLVVLFFLNRVRAVHKNAERMAILGEINAMRGGVVAMLKPPKNIPQQNGTGMNPLQVLQTPPKNYLGPIENPEDTEIPPGSWYFHPENSTLVFWSRYTHEFPFTQKPTRRIRLRLEKPHKAHLRPNQRILTCGQNICLTAPQ
jgi:hypothetical protein